MRKGSWLSKSQDRAEINNFDSVFISKVTNRYTAGHGWWCKTILKLTACARKFITPEGRTVPTASAGWDWLGWRSPLPPLSERAILHGACMLMAASTLCQLLSGSAQRRAGQRTGVSWKAWQELVLGGQRLMPHWWPGELDMDTPLLNEFSTSLSVEVAPVSHSGVNLSQLSHRLNSSIFIHDILRESSLWNLLQLWQGSGSMIQHSEMRPRSYGGLHWCDTPN